MSPAAEQIIAAIERWRSDETGPLVVAIDGHGAAGKTTLAAAVAGALKAKVVHTDDYFHAAEDGGDPRPMAQYYAWQTLREQELEPAIGDRHDPRSAARLILVEGVSSAAPALADLVGRTVFVQTPEPVRLGRLHARISDEEWFHLSPLCERSRFRYAFRFAVFVRHRSESKRLSIRCRIKNLLHFSLSQYPTAFSQVAFSLRRSKSLKSIVVLRSPEDVVVSRLSRDRPRSS